RFDFKGNLVHATQQVAKALERAPDWSELPVTTEELLHSPAASALDTEIFSFFSEYDALNRMVAKRFSDGSEVRPSYNETGLVQRVELVAHDGERTTTLRDVEYNARGQRVRVMFGNGVEAQYDYDAETFRLQRQRATRDDGIVIQDVRYTYDPVGNIVAS